MYMDGLLHTRTALVLGNYSYPEPDLGIGDNGVHYMLEQRVAKYVAELQGFTDDGFEREGFDFHIHAIGDLAAREALNAIEQTQAWLCRLDRFRL